MQPGGLRRDDTIRDLSGARAASLRGSLHQRARSDAMSSDFALNDRDVGGLDGGRARSVAMSVARTQSDRTKNAVREAEERLRGLAWETMRERFEQYSDEVRFCLDRVFGSEKLTQGIG